MVKEERHLSIWTGLRMGVSLWTLGWSVAGAVAGVAVGTVFEDYQSLATLNLASPGEGAANAARFVLEKQEQRAAEREPTVFKEQRAAEREPTVFNQGMSIPDYRRFRAAIASTANFAAFARRAAVGEPIQHTVRAHLATEKGAAELIAPIYSQTRGEIRDVGEIRLDRGEPVVTALRVSFRADTPETAVVGAKILTDYVQDTLFRDAILTQLVAKAAVARSVKLSAEAESLERSFAITQIEATVRDLKHVAQQYPESARLEGRQVVSVQGDGGKYLSPIAQIVAAESRLVEARREFDRLARMALQADAALQFFEAAHPIVSDPLLSATDICDRLVELVRVRLQAPEAKNDAVQARLLEVLAWLSNLRSIHTDQIRLVAEPSMPEQPQPPTRSQMGATGALLGLFLALAVGTIRQRARRESPQISQDPR